MTVSSMMIPGRSEQTRNRVIVFFVFMFRESLVLDNVEIDFALTHGFSETKALNI